MMVKVAATLEVVAGRFCSPRQKAGVQKRKVSTSGHKSSLPPPHLTTAIWKVDLSLLSLMRRALRDFVSQRNKERQLFLVFQMGKPLIQFFLTWACQMQPDHKTLSPHPFPSV